MDWEYDLLWQKAKLFAQRAHESGQEGPLFPLWSALCLELLGRATIAHVHPALLADPAEGENIMYAFNYSTEKSPKSIPTITVFRRCMKVAETFTNSDFDFCMNLMERRNRELHTGAAAFENFGTEFWLYDFYRVCKILLGAQKKDLTDLLSDDDAEIAKKMIAVEASKVEKGVKEIIRLAKDDFYRRTKEEHQRLRDQAVAQNLAAMSRKLFCVEVKCPACGTGSLLSGEKTRAREPYLENDTVIREVSILPVMLECYACGLKLDGYEKVRTAGFGGLKIVREEHEPSSYFEFDPADYGDGGYGND